MNRWLTGIILSLLVLLTIFYAPVFYIKILLAFISCLAIHEYLRLTLKAKVALSLLGILLTALGVWLIGITTLIADHILLYIYAILVLSFVVGFAARKDEAEIRIRNSVFFLFGLVYCVFLYGVFCLLLNRDNYRFWLILTLACTFLADTGAFVLGRAFGKKKLFPKISPNKTQVGVFAAIVFSVLAGIVARQILWPDFSLLMTVLLAVLIAVLGIVGDLSESLLKRGFGVKDSGKLIPGHGGVLDRMDALLFTAPFVYFVSFFF